MATLGGYHFLTLVLILSGNTRIAVLGSTHYTIMGDLRSWTSANMTCDLAKPTLVTSMKHNVTLTLTDHPEVTLMEGEEMWVGYVQKPQMLQYVGCIAHEHDDPLLATHYETQMDLGQCLTRCDTTKYIAILENECFCLDALPDDVNTRRKTCTQECRDEEGVVCGGRDTVSIYKNIKITNPSLVTEHRLVNAAGNCVAYNGNSGLFTYTRCTYSFSPKCVTDTGSIVSLGGYMSWRQMVDACTSIQMAPLDLSTALMVKDAYNVWTGLVKANRILDTFTDGVSGYGFVRRQNGMNYLKFERSSSASRKPFLCQTAGLTTIVPPTTGQAAVKTAKKDLLALYIVLPIVAILIVVVVIIIVERRRRKKGREIVNELEHKHRLHLYNNGYNHSYVDAEDGFAEDKNAKALRRASQHSLPPSKAPPRRGSTNYDISQNPDGNTALVATLTLDGAIPEHHESVDGYDSLDHDHSDHGNHGNGGHGDLRATVVPPLHIEIAGRQDQNGQLEHYVVQSNSDAVMDGSMGENGEYARINKLKKNNGFDNGDIAKYENTVNHDVPGFQYDRAAF